MRAPETVEAYSIRNYPGRLIVARPPLSLKVDWLRHDHFGG